MPRRINIPTTINTALARKGRRQPQDRKSSSGSRVTKANAPTDSKIPSGDPTKGRLPKKPRQRGGACSTAISMAPPSSPPNDKPCPIRNATSKIGAHTPICS
ncbi:hypothetical protein D3C87_1431780 [compost metagenome]